MDDIKVGDYVRTKDGEFGKIRVIIDNMIFINNNQYYHNISDVKVSENLLDLIEKRRLCEWRKSNTSKSRK